MRYSLKKIFANSSIETRNYTLLEEAKDAMDTINDFEGLSMVALFDIETNVVVRLFHFENGKLRASFWDGDIVRLRKNYSNPGEGKYIYRVTDINENTGRCLITCENSGTPIPCSESVGVEMIEEVK